MYAYTWHRWADKLHQVWLPWPCSGFVQFNICTLNCTLMMQHLSTPTKLKHWSIWTEGNIGSWRVCHRKVTGVSQGKGGTVQLQLVSSRQSLQQDRHNCPVAAQEPSSRACMSAMLVLPQRSLFSLILSLLFPNFVSFLCKFCIRILPVLKVLILRFG